MGLGDFVPACAWMSSSSCSLRCITSPRLQCHTSHPLCTSTLWRTKTHESLWSVQHRVAREVVAWPSDHFFTEASESCCVLTHPGVTVLPLHGMHASVAISKSQIFPEAALASSSQVLCSFSLFVQSFHCFQSSNLARRLFVSARHSGRSGTTGKLCKCDAFLATHQGC